MIEILRLSDLTRITHYPKEVVEAIRKSVTLLDSAYGVTRTKEGDGDLEIIVETEAELQALIQSFYWGDVPEFAELVHQDFIRATYILTNDRGIEVYLPKEWATQAMKEVMEK